MMTPRSRTAATPADAGRDAGRDAGPMVASRLIAVLRTGRSYAIGNPVFTAQLDQLLEVLAPVLLETGEARLTIVDDELCFNGTPISTRIANARHAEQLVHELLLREIKGVRFLDGLTLPELEMFMRFFVPSEIHRGTELERAVAAQGVSHVLPLIVLDEPKPVIEENEETPAAFALGLESANRLMREARALTSRGLPRGVETHHYKRLVQPVVDAALAHQSISAGLAELDEGGIEAWVHGVRVCLLTVGVGHALGLDRATVAEIGASALLHAITTADLPRAGEPAAMATARRTALARLTQRTSLDPATLVALQLPYEWDATAATRSAHGEIVAIADAYVKIASSREHGALRWTPYEALGLILGPMAERFHPAVRLALVQALGVFPPGQIVELDDGSVMRVCAADASDAERPYLERMTGPAGSRAAVHARGRVSATPAGRTIARAVPFARGSQAA